MMNLTDPSSTSSAGLVTSGDTGAKPDFWRGLIRNRMAVWGLIAVVVMTLLSVVGQFLNPFDANHIDIINRFAPPLQGGHLLGSDELGRDMLARLMAGGRISMAIGFVSMVISVVLGTAIGMVAGYRGGLVGAVLMRFVDAVMAFPTIFLVLALALLVKPGIVSTTLLIAATSWMGVARLVESQYRALRGQEYAAAARTYGASAFRIMVIELLPNAAAAIIVVATLNIARAILLESYVSYLGYGIQPPVASWGNMLNSAQIYLTSAPWLAIVPGVAITLTVMSFNLIGEGLRDILEPRS